MLQFFSYLAFSSYKILNKQLRLVKRLNKILFYLSLLKHSILHPKNGLQMIEVRQQTLHDASEAVYSYKEDRQSLDDVLNHLFPQERISFVDFKENIRPLQNKLQSFFANLESEKYPSRNKPYPTDYSLSTSSGLFLYILCKLTKPEKVVETGVAYGNSSSYILQALKENKKGTLYSIDSIFRPWESKEMIGSAIPVELRQNWKFIFGPTTEKLPKILKQLGSIDIFFHDSLHTYKNMMFEFETAWPFIKKNGFLLSDDIIENNAFNKFYSTMNVEPFIIPQENSVGLFGIIQKKHD